MWDQFRKADGTPAYPQRPMILGPVFAAAAAGTVQTGRFEGKMIVVESLRDREALPWQADWDRSKVEEHFGDSLDDHFRLWFTDNALHGDDEVQDDPTHTVTYLRMLHQALRDLNRWVEEGISPPPSTDHEVVDGQIVVPPDSTARQGVQLVVSLTVDGGARADVGVAREVTLRATAAAARHRAIRGARVGFRRRGPLPTTRERGGRGDDQRGAPVDRSGARDVLPGGAGGGAARRGQGHSVRAPAEPGAVRVVVS